MKIESSQINLFAKHQSEQRHSLSEKIDLQVTDPSKLRVARLAAAQLQPPPSNNIGVGSQSELAFSFRASFSSVSIQISHGTQAANKANAADETDLSKEKTIDELKVKILIAMIEKLTGKKLKFEDAEKLEKEMQEAQESAEKTNQDIANATGGANQSAGFSLSYERHEYYYESEQMSFQAEGIVKTADGREININLQLNMSREFATENHISIRAGDALKDPLVINFSGAAAQLTQESFAFDIDSNGSLDQIHFVREGSGFLALDKNEDGKINDGSELFGPTSGNGFAELAQYDIDKNNFIDEGDPIYEKLRIWVRDPANPDQPQLFALGDKNIGAIYLGNINTPFEIKNQSNELLGKVQKSGIYLSEDGGVGSVNHVDLKV